MFRDVGPQHLNVAAELPRSVANGPGVRYVIWVQGCPFYCVGCFNEEFQPFVLKQVVAVDALAERILSTGGIEGVTYSGGEPMAQAEALAGLSAILKRGGLTVMCYTGFTLPHLQHRGNPHTTELLDLVDILVDGPYLRDKGAALPWRGSSNQRVHFLTKSYAPYEHPVDRPTTEMELVIGNNQVNATGMVQVQIWTRLQRLLEGETGASIS